MKKLMISIVLLSSLFAHAQWSDITPKGWYAGNHPQMFDSLNYYCMTKDTVSPWQPMIIKTGDGGKTWVEVCKSFTNPADNIYDYIFFSKDSLMVSTYSKKIYVSFDSGKTLALLNNVPTGFRGIGTEYLFYSRFSKTIFIMTSNSGVFAFYKTSDFGQSWVVISSDKPTKFGINLLCFVDSKIGYSIGGDSALFKTTDNGSNWGKVGNTPINSGKSMIFTSENTGYFIGWSSSPGPYKTTDGGKSWFLQSGGLPEFDPISCQISDMYFSDDLNGWLVLYCNGGYHYYRTENGGEYWGQLEFFNPACQLGYITGVDKNNLVLWPYNVQTCIYRTTNGGGPYSGITEKPGEENSIRIFPNPANSTLTICLNRETNKNTKAFIINLQGQTLLQSELLGKENSVDISKLPAGVYFVKVVDEKGVWVGKVVKE